VIWIGILRRYLQRRHRSVTRPGERSEDV
jgi:hypothetical protein